MDPLLVLRILDILADLFVEEIIICLVNVVLMLL